MSGKRGGPEDENDDKKHAPVPRHLPSKSVTLHFVQRTWEQIGRGEIKYHPCHTNPFYSMDEPMKNQFKRFRNLWSTMEFHGVEYTMKNFVLLQDDFKIASGTPQDTSTLVQVIYALTYQPTGQSEYFSLYDVNDTVHGRGERLTYDLQPQDGSQLIVLNGFENFSRLGLLPAKINQFAGYIPGTLPTIDKTNLSIVDPYISPDASLFRQVSGSLNIPTTNNFVSNNNSITYCRNMDKYIPIRYGDVITTNVVTNLGNVKLINHENNDFTNRDSYLIIPEGTIKKVAAYKKEFSYPSANRPYYSRSSNFSTYSPLLNPKEFQRLNHKFICMPPIFKANGTLLGQRASFLLETSFSVTFNFNEAIFDDEEAREFLSQKAAVILRPNVHSKLVESHAMDTDGSVCGNKKLKCEQESAIKQLAPNFCPEDNFEGWSKLMGEIDNDEFNKIFKVQSEPPSHSINIIASVEQVLDINTAKSSNFITNWVYEIKSESEDTVCVKIINPTKISADEYLVTLWGTKTKFNELKFKSDKPISVLYLMIDIIQFNVVKGDYGITCVISETEPNAKRFKPTVDDVEFQVPIADFISDVKHSNVFYV